MIVKASVMPIVTLKCVESGPSDKNSTPYVASFIGEYTQYLPIIGSKSEPTMTSVSEIPIATAVLNIALNASVKARTNIIHTLYVPIILSTPLNGKSPNKMVV